jgi:hypothetical protein
LFIPQSLNSLEAAFCHPNSSFDVLGLLALDPRLQLCHELLRRALKSRASSAR